MFLSLIFTVRPHTLSWDSSLITPQGEDYIPVTLRPPNFQSVLPGMYSQWLVKVQPSFKDPNGKAKLENEDHSIDFSYRGMLLSYQIHRRGHVNKHWTSQSIFKICIAKYKPYLIKFMTLLILRNNTIRSTLPIKWWLICWNFNFLDI